MGDAVAECLLAGRAASGVLAVNEPGIASSSAESGHREEKVTLADVRFRLDGAKLPLPQLSAGFTDRSSSLGRLRKLHKQAV